MIPEDLAALHFCILYTLLWFMIADQVIYICKYLRISGIFAYICIYQVYQHQQPPFLSEQRKAKKTSKVKQIRQTNSETQIRKANPMKQI